MRVLHEVVNQQPFYDWLENNNERVEELLVVGSSTIISYEESRDADDFEAIRELTFWSMGSSRSFEILPYDAAVSYVDNKINQLRKEFKLWDLKNRRLNKD